MAKIKVEPQINVVEIKSQEKQEKETVMAKKIVKTKGGNNRQGDGQEKSADDGKLGQGQTGPEGREQEQT